MSFPRLLTIAIVLAVALPLTASAQDRRSPDAADPIPTLQMSGRRSQGPDAPIVQELRTLNTGDDAVTPAPVREAPSASPDPFPWLEAGALAALALVLIGLALLVTRRHRVGASA